MKSLWGGLGRGARWGLGLGVAVILAATLAIGWWAWHTDYEVLFSKLSAQDAAAMTRELDQMKVPYRLGDDGTTILVDRATVHQTRLKLMGKDLPLHGAVGFELFNNSDFGMTEFAQKVNYQRALQGELTRTILSLAEVESARVHLAFPDEGLFKREQNRAKASITLTLHEGRALRREQVRGIQRLVAAAVPGIETRDVTIVSDQGVALTQEGEDTAGGAAPASMRMEVKREIEQYLSHKANTLLDKAFGPGQALASVDVTIDMNQVRVTTEDVLTPAAPAGEGPAGVVLRERETTRDSSGGRGGANAGTDTGAPGSVHREVDYQLGRRVEQVVSSPGAVTRLQALAILRAPLNPAQVEQVRQLLSSAVGASRERGDVVVVQPLEGLAANVVAAPAVASQMPAAAAATAASVVTNDSESNSASARPWTVVQSLAGVLALAAVLMAGLFVRLKGRATAPAQPMSAAQREASMAQLRTWMAQADIDGPTARSGR
ncbi:flagellar basal-body MS-ring/collar protein FliF [Ideonella sp. YS5]|uniref:flagellar basal-body MS-ring/collar protein FliF n=1 Tax=Ideonella sp. YS5 TaxID=3453714 RepID=UPI003EEF3E10